VAKRGGCGILLDINNVYVNSVNHHFDPKTFVNGLPASRIGQIHMAGFLDKGSYLLDTHSRPVHDEVWSLYQYVLRKIPDSVPTVLEWDDEIPDFPDLEDEAL